MFAATIISVAAFVAQAVASPVDSVPAPIVLKRTGPTVGDAAAKCGNGNVLACCNSGDKESNGGLIGDLPILGGNCNTLDVSVIGVTLSLGAACSSQVACCQGDSKGELLDLKCAEVNVL